MKVLQKLTETSLDISVRIGQLVMYALRLVIRVHTALYPSSIMRNADSSMATQADNEWPRDARTSGSHQANLKA